MPIAYRFTGQRWDGVIKLYDYKARYDDPAIGRFIQPDPIVPDPANPQDLNRHTYVRNNPVRYTDPSGHWLETAWDVANILWDIYEIRRDPGNLWNWGALALDVGAAVLPGVPGGVGLLVRGGKALAHAPDILRIAEAINWAERFAGASPEIMKGVQWLEKLVKSERMWEPYRRGLAAELLRAEQLFKEGKLKAVEVVVEGGWVDFILVTDEIVEVKYWRQQYTEQNVKRLAGQLKKYQQTGRPIILELVQTKINPITEEFILEKLLPELQKEGLSITWEQIRLITLP